MGLISWSFLCLGVMLVGRPELPGATAILLEPVIDSPAAPDWAWSPWASHVGWVMAWAEWPFWLFTLVAALLVGTIVREVSKFVPLWASVCLAAGLSLTISPRDIPSAGLVLLAVCITAATHLDRRPLTRLGSMTALAVCALLVSLEFTLIGLIAATLLLGGQNLQGVRTKTMQRRAFGLWIVTLFVLVALHKGLRQAALRPVSWMWLDIPDSLLPSMGPVFSGQNDWFSALLLCLFLGLAWALNVRRPQVGWFQVFVMGILTVLGLSVGRYLWLGAAGVALLIPRSDRWQPQARWTRLAVGLVTILLLATGVSSHAGAYYGLLIGAGAPPAQVDPRHWNLRGPVVLLNLDQTSDWNAGTIRSRFQPLVTDRWDVFGSQYRDYALLCRDIREISIESYLLSNGEWGGYRGFLNKWRPRLLVADIRDVVAIRNLSLSPDWRLLSLDGDRAVFAGAEDRRAQPHTQRTMRVLRQLEWPTNPTVDRQVIVAPDAESSRRVAAALCALRLPYAGLHLLPKDEHPKTQAQRMWCYLELAHRAWQYTGEPSLLDQYRAAAAASDQLAGNRLTYDERRRLIYGLKAIRANGAADARPGKQEIHDSETAVRRALLRGDSDDAAVSMQSLPENQQEYFEAILESPGRSAIDVYQSLSEHVDGGALPDDLRSEALFLLGCLAIEAGDAGTAAVRLNDSLSIERQTARTPLAQFYLVQLGVAPGRTAEHSD